MQSIRLAHVLARPEHAWLAPDDEADDDVKIATWGQVNSVIASEWNVSAEEYVLCCRWCRLAAYGHTSSPQLALN